MVSLSFSFKPIKATLVLLIIMQTGCKKFVRIDPPTTAIASSTVYNNNTSAAAAMSGVYSNMMNSNYGTFSSGQGSLGYLMGLAADELVNYSPGNPLNGQFYANALTSNTGGVSNNYFWTELYNEIYFANAILTGLKNSTGVTTSVKQQITGEAKFMRAFLHFYATNLYGDVPIAITTDYQVNNVLPRSPVTDVYRQIVADLKDAQAVLSDNFVDGVGGTTNGRVRPNKGAASALLARVYLYQKKWDSAEAQATAVINNTQYSLVNNPDNVFLANSTEAIWQLQPVDPGYNTFDGFYFVLTAPPGDGQYNVSLSTHLDTAFEAGDIRSKHWIGAYTQDSITYYYYPNKYKIGVNDPQLPVTEYTMVLRLAEQYLIRAEARAEQKNITGAKADLNAIRVRAGLLVTAANDQPSLLTAIYHERQVELFTEWGHRWFDLKRTGRLNAVMTVVTPQKGGVWSPDWALLPIPLVETQINPNLRQNPGYN